MSTIRVTRYDISGKVTDVGEVDTLEEAHAFLDRLGKVITPVRVAIPFTPGPECDEEAA